MRTRKLLLFTISLIFSMSLVNANEVEPRGIDLGEYAFGIPAEQLNFTNQSPFTFSFWVNIKEFNHSEQGTQFINIRKPDGDWIYCDWGYIWSNIGTLYDDYENIIGEDMLSMATWESQASVGTLFKPLKYFQFYPKEWVYVSFVFYFTKNPQIKLYINGEVALVFESVFDNGSPLLDWYDEYIIMIGEDAYGRSALNAYVDKVQFYNRALTQSEVQSSMYEPLLNDESLLGYWDFENGCTTDSEGYMMADNGTIKASMYKILQQNNISIGTEIQSFTFGEGVNPEDILQGVEDNKADIPQTKAYVSNGVLYVKSREEIKNISIYDSMGRTLFTPNPSSAEMEEIAIPLDLNIKGLLLVKVNNEVVKVII